MSSRNFGSCAYDTLLNIPEHSPPTLAGSSTSRLAAVSRVAQLEYLCQGKSVPIPNPSCSVRANITFRFHSTILHGSLVVLQDVAGCTIQRFRVFLTTLQKTICLCFVSIERSCMIVVIYCSPCISAGRDMTRRYFAQNASMPQ